MYLQQLSIFVENRTGRAAEVTNLLGKEGVNIRAIALADTLDFGIIRLIVNDVPKALQVLRDHDFRVSVTDILAVEIPDAPGGLGKVLEVLAEEKINVGYLYGFVERAGESAVLFFRFDPMETAITVLQKHGFHILSQEELHFF